MTQAVQLHQHSHSRNDHSLYLSWFSHFNTSRFQIQESKSPAHLHPSTCLVILLQCIMTSYLIMLSRIRTWIKYFYFSTLTLFLQNFRQNDHFPQPSSPSTLPSLPKVFYSLCAVSSFFVQLGVCSQFVRCSPWLSELLCLLAWFGTCHAWTEFILAFFQERGSLLP